jgi:hypothetical protein
VAPAEAPPPKKKLVQQPWFWAAVVVGAGAVATAIALGVVYGRPHDPTPSLGIVKAPAP